MVVQTEIVYEMIMSLILNQMVKWQRYMNFTQRGKGWGFLAGVLRGILQLSVGTIEGTIEVIIKIQLSNFSTSSCKNFFLWKSFFNILP